MRFRSPENSFPPGCTAWRCSSAFVESAYTDRPAPCRRLRCRWSWRPRPTNARRQLPTSVMSSVQLTYSTKWRCQPRNHGGFAPEICSLPPPKNQTNTILTAIYDIHGNVSRRPLPPKKCYLLLRKIRLPQKLWLVRCMEDVLVEKCPMLTDYYSDVNLALYYMVLSGILLMRHRLICLHYVLSWFLKSNFVKMVGNISEIHRESKTFLSLIHHMLTDS